MRLDWADAHLLVQQGYREEDDCRPREILAVRAKRETPLATNKDSLAALAGRAFGILRPTPTGRSMGKQVVHVLFDLSI